MTNDSITDEIRAIRRELAAQFDNDVSKILADVRKREAADGHVYVTLPKRCHPSGTAIPDTAPAGSPTKVAGRVN